MCMVLTTLGLDYERKVHVGCNATYVGPIITSLPSDGLVESKLNSSETAVC